jgi:hypothetical protein
MKRPLGVGVKRSKHNSPIPSFQISQKTPKHPTLVTNSPNITSNFHTHFQVSKTAFIFEASFGGENSTE